MKKYEIVIICYWTHPEVGGQKTDVYTYPINEVNKAIQKYQSLLQNDGGYQQTTCHIQEAK